MLAWSAEFNQLVILRSLKQAQLYHPGHQTPLFNKSVLLGVSLQDKRVQQLVFRNYLVNIWISDADLDNFLD